MKATEQGLNTGKRTRYSVIPRTLIFLTHTDASQGRQILLIKGAPTKRLWANKYNGIGGHVEWNEDVLAAAQRELAEETGITDVALSLRGVLNIAVSTAEGGPTGVAVFLFCGEAPTRTVVASPEGTPDWLPLDALAHYPLVDDLYQLIPRLMADDRPVYGRYYADEDGMMHYVFNS